MNKSQIRKRKESEKSSAIFKGKLGIYENIMGFFILLHTGRKYFDVLLYLWKLTFIKLYLTKIN